jgi:hypothetical protein
VLGLQHIEVYEVASFYSMFNLHPVGTYVLDVCRTTPCMLRGSDDLITHLEQEARCALRRDHGKDGMFTLKAVECLGSCGTAPCCNAAPTTTRTSPSKRWMPDRLQLARPEFTDQLHGSLMGRTTPASSTSTPPASVGWRATVRTAATAAWRRP